jgi:hypothetical protein
VLFRSLGAQGEAASSNRAGGGAGGSVLVSASSLIGRGVLRCDGGLGQTTGGGGSGGRVSLTVTRGRSGWYGQFTALGGQHGASAQSGGGGTVYEAHASQVTIDNGNAGLTRTVALESGVGLVSLCFWARPRCRARRWTSTRCGVTTVAPA